MSATADPVVFISSFRFGFSDFGVPGRTRLHVVVMKRLPV
jgi:hypothetical protein